MDKQVATRQIVKILKEFPLDDAHEMLSQAAAAITPRQPRSSKLQGAVTTPDKVMDALLSIPSEYEEAWRRLYDIVDGIFVDSEVDIKFDLENFECGIGGDEADFFGSLMGPRMFGKLAGVGCYGGGDWEVPLFFIIYLSADDNKPKIYVPKQGNAYNHDTKMALGNAENTEDFAFLRRWLSANKPGVDIDELLEQELYVAAEPMFDKDKILKDIADNIEVVR